MQTVLAVDHVYCLVFAIDNSFLYNDIRTVTMYINMDDLNQLQVASLFSLTHI